MFFLAKYTRHLTGNFSQILNKIHDGIMNGSVSASFEESEDFDKDGVRCAVRVYERYSYFGGNRVSLNVTLFGADGDVDLCAVTSGGSQAMFFKINTVGEENFLQCLIDIVNDLD